MNDQRTVVVVLANPKAKFDGRAGVVSDLCHTFIERCKQRGFIVDLIDLYEDHFNPVHIPNERDNQTLEYQIRIQKAHHIIIFHPVWWGSMPAILKGFCEKVFQNGFAYRYSRGSIEGLLNDKKALVVVVTKSPLLESVIMHSAGLNHAWKRLIFDICGIHSQVKVFYNLRKVSDKTIVKWHQNCIELVDSL
jgi:NAD(P)H dehydrogenase (quinone)